MHSRQQKAIVLLLVSYVFLYFLYLFLDFLPKWDGYGTAFLSGGASNAYVFVDPLFGLMPLIGFAFAWLSISWYLRRFKDESILTVPYALGFVILSYVTYFIALFGYFWNNAFLTAMVQGRPNPGFFSFGPTWAFVSSNFVDQLLPSAFFLFVLSALLGWVSYVVIHSFWKEKLPHLL